MSKLFVSSENALGLAARVLENVGSLAGWAVAYRDAAGARKVVATGPDLQRLATPFLPDRTPEEAEHMRRFREARQRTLGPPSRARPVDDEREY